MALGLPLANHTPRILGSQRVQPAPPEPLAKVLCPLVPELISPTKCNFARPLDAEPIRIYPSRILDAPGIEDDFYLTLLDWSISTNCIAMGLGNALYCWHAATYRTTQLNRLVGDDRVASVAWKSKEPHLAVGTKSGKLLLYDAETKSVIRKFIGHCSRIGVLSWNAGLGPANGVLTSGSRDKHIVHHDPRAPVPIASVLFHKQEVCGLKWDPTGRRLASGGNDNKLYVAEDLCRIPTHQFEEHVAAVKAVAWSPHTAGLLASGGGTADRSVRFWNTKRPDLSSIKSIVTSSQVCNMAWSPHSNELVTTHGFSDHHIVRWEYPSLRESAIMTGHQQRVLYLCTSPDGTSIVTGSADETLRFWPIFQPRRPSAIGRLSGGNSHSEYSECIRHR